LKAPSSACFSSTPVAFDPYLIWLDISPHERPVNYYRLFGLRPLESDPNVIAAAAQRVLAHVAQFQNSPNAAACQQLLGELNAARTCLLDPLRKRAYDGGLTSPGGSERTLATAPPVPGGAPFVQPTPAPSSTPAWLAKAQASRTAPATRAGERQIGGTPPPPNAGAPAPMSPTTAGMSSRPAAPYVPMQPAQQLQPPGVPMPAQPAKIDAPLKPLHPSGAIPFGTAPIVPQSGYSPPSSAMGYGSAYTPATPSLPQQSAPQMPPMASPPHQPPAWAMGDRTGRVATVVAGDDERSNVATDPPPRRVVRRQQTGTVVYVVVALAIAMIVFFFGAVLLLALFLAAN
jgi:hypothetical protein